MWLAIRWGFAGSSVLTLAACATGGGTAASGEALDRTCTVANCFYQRDIRDFEVIDNTTLIVYVGQQRCAFQLELVGTFCDMTMAPDLYFRTDSRAIADPNRPPRGSPDDLRNTPRPGLMTEAQRRNVELERGMAANRICGNDFVQVDGGVFTELFEEPAVGLQQGQCRVTSLTSITDDQLVELYVERGVTPPPPPIGGGTIQVGESDADSGSEGDAAPAEPVPEAASTAPGAPTEEPAQAITGTRAP